VNILARISRGFSRPALAAWVLGAHSVAHTHSFIDEPRSF
jgi:hypothetical protein